MTIRGKASIAGAYEHPLRVIPDRTVAQVHADVAVGARADAGYIGLSTGPAKAFLEQARVGLSAGEAAVLINAPVGAASAIGTRSRTRRVTAIS